MLTDKLNVVRTIRTHRNGDQRDQSNDSIREENDQVEHDHPEITDECMAYAGPISFRAHQVE